jgi:hypothetical protein
LQGTGNYAAKDDVAATERPMLLAPFFSFFNLHFNSSDAAWVTVFVLFCLVSPFETTLLPQTLIDSFSWTILAATLLHPV